MSVGTYALTSVAEVFAYLGEAAERDAIWLYFSGTTNTNTVTVNDTSLVLVDADNSPSTTTLLFSTYTTLTTLVAAINLVTGWSAGLIYIGSASPGDLVTTGALDAEGVANKQTLKIKDVYLIERLIDRASDFIERYCNRLFVSRTHTNEIYLGHGRTDLILEQYPVTEVARVVEGRTNAFSIKNTSTDANFCTAELTSTKLELVVDGGANAVTGTNAFTLASYASIDLLIVAVVAAGGGWSCTTLATDTSTRDADELLIRPCMYVDSTKQAYLEIPNNMLTDYLLRKPRSEDRNEGILYYPSIFSEGVEYFVTYTAGYSSIPAALESIVIELVKYKYDKRERSGDLKSEKIGNVYAYEKFSLADLKYGLSPDLVEEVSYFKKWII